jgi:hypothetical protein
LDFATLDPGFANIIGLLGELREVAENNPSAEAVFTGSGWKGPGVGFKGRGGGVSKIVGNELLGRSTANGTRSNLGVLLDCNSVQGVAHGFKVRNEAELAWNLLGLPCVGCVFSLSSSLVIRVESNVVRPNCLTEVTSLQNFLIRGTMAVNCCAVGLLGSSFHNANILTVGVTVFVTNNVGIE